MTVIQFAGIRVDTDAGGEPCVVADVNQLVAAYTKTERIAAAQDAKQFRAALATDPNCIVCRAPIASVNEAAYLTTRDRVIHVAPCLSRYMAWAAAFRGPRVRSAGSETAELEQAFADAADEDLDRAIDGFLVEAPTYATLRAPVLFVGSQKCTFKHRALDLIDTAPPAIVIDMTDTRYVDTGGLGALVSARHAYRRAVPAGKMLLVGVNAEIRTLFELTRLETMFQLAATFPEAEDAIRG